MRKATARKQELRGRRNGAEPSDAGSHLHTRLTSSISASFELRGSDKSELRVKCASGERVLKVVVNGQEVFSNGLGESELSLRIADWILSMREDDNAEVFIWLGSGPAPAYGVIFEPDPDASEEMRGKKIGESEIRERFREEIARAELEKSKPAPEEASSVKKEERGKEAAGSEESKASPEEELMRKDVIFKGEVPGLFAIVIAPLDFLVSGEVPMVQIERATNERFEISHFEINGEDVPSMNSEFGLGSGHVKRALIKELAEETDGLLQIRFYVKLQDGEEHFCFVQAELEKSWQATGDEIPLEIDSPDLMRRFGEGKPRKTPSSL